MTLSYDRIAGIVRADLRFRFRRTTALVTLLVVGAGVYLIVPDIGSGRTLMQIEGRRVLYNSAAVALGTGMFCTLFLSLAGYYLVSNSFRRDILARTGFVIAATPVSNTEYILGKFIGSGIYLSAIMLTCMTSAMVMFFIRGEGELEPFTFLFTYAWMVIPAIAFCASAALAFEALPFLAGKFGDLLYFLLWGALLGFPIGLFEGHSRAEWLGMVDIVGIVQVLVQVREQFHTTSVSIGASTFNASLPPTVYTMLPWSWIMFVERLSTLILPALLLIVARGWFHRFNPARIKSSVRHGSKSLIVRVNALLKPVTRFIGPLGSIARFGGRASFSASVSADVLATLMLTPLTTISIVVFAIVSLSVDFSALRGGVLPALFVALILALADGAPRDRSAGMMGLIFTAPYLRANYVLWKFASSLCVAAAFTMVPAVRLFSAAPSAAFSLAIGSFFTASAAVALGVLSGSRKPFIAIFLMLLYVSLNSSNFPAFDFAGFYGRTTAGIQLTYAVLAVLLILAGHLRHRRTLANL
jgi:hypothetical protein